MKTAVAPVESPFRRIASDFAASRLALAGLAVFVLILIVALGAPFISPQNPYNLAELDILDAKRAPGGRSRDGSPHPRGDGPGVNTNAHRLGMFSPPAWGWSGP